MGDGRDLIRWEEKIAMERRQRHAWVLLLPSFPRRGALQLPILAFCKRSATAEISEPSKPSEALQPFQLACTNTSQGLMISVDISLPSQRRSPTLRGISTLIKPLRRPSLRLRRIRRSWPPSWRLVVAWSKPWQALFVHGQCRPTQPALSAHQFAFDTPSTPSKLGGSFEREELDKSLIRSRFLPITSVESMLRTCIHTTTKVRVTPRSEILYHSIAKIITSHTRRRRNGLVIPSTPDVTSADAALRRVKLIDS